jgi:hypothetical protein
MHMQRHARTLLVILFDHGEQAVGHAAIELDGLRVTNYVDALAVAGQQDGCGFRFVDGVCRIH